MCNAESEITPVFTLTLAIATLTDLSPLTLALAGFCGRRKGPVIHTSRVFSLGDTE